MNRNDVILVFGIVLGVTIISGMIVSISLMPRVIETDRESDEWYLECAEARKLTAEGTPTCCKGIYNKENQMCEIYPEIK